MEVLGRHLGPLGELLGPSAPKSASRTGKIGRRVAPRVPNWDPILDMLAPSSRKELSEQCFLGGPLRDQILSDFLVLFQGVRTLKIELPCRRELNSHFFAKFDFSSILDSILGHFWSHFGPRLVPRPVQSRFLEGCGSVLKKR